MTSTYYGAPAGTGLVTTYAYDAAGRQTMVDGPRSGTDDASYTRYDTIGRKTWEIGAKRLDGYRAATHYYPRDADDKPNSIDKGVVVNPTDTTMAIVLEQSRYAYDPTTRNLNSTITAAGGVDDSVTQYSYDARNRSDCTAIRMNPAVWNALPGVCSLSAGGAPGPDRVTKTSYDSLSRVLSIRKAVGTSIEQAYVTYSYTPNGKQQYVTDANGNRAQLSYDGLDRLQRWYFPSTAVERASRSSRVTTSVSPSRTQSSTASSWSRCPTDDACSLNSLLQPVAPSAACCDSSPATCSTVLVQAYPISI